MQFNCCPRLWNDDTLILTNWISANKVNTLKAMILMPKMHSQIIQDSGKICKANGLGRDFIFFFQSFL